MSNLAEIIESAPFNIESLVNEMIEGDHPDNWVSLGRIMVNGKEAQVQVKVTSNRSEFYDSDEEDIEQEANLPEIKLHNKQRMSA